MPTNTRDLTIVQRMVGQSTELFGHKDWYTVYSGDKSQHVPATFVRSLPNHAIDIYSVTYWEGGPCTVFFACDKQLSGRSKTQQVLVRSEDEKQRFLGLSDQEKFMLFGF